MWDRLPRGVRIARTIGLAALATLFGVFMPPMVLVILRTISGDYDAADALVGGPWFRLVAVPIAVMYATLGWTFMWKRQFGLSARDRLKLLNEPLQSPFWRRPDIAPILGVVASVTPLAPQSPDALARAIAGAVPLLPETVRASAAEAAELAREAAAWAVRMEHASWRTCPRRWTRTSAPGSSPG